MSNAEWHQYRAHQPTDILARYRRGRHAQAGLIRRRSRRIAMAVAIAAVMLPTILLGS